LARRALAVVALSCAVAGCSGPLSTLRPGGRGAARIEQLWWVLFWVGLAIYAVVVLALLAALARRSRRRRSDPRGLRATLPVLLGGVALPAVVLPVLFVLTLDTMAAFARGDADVRIEVVGKRWWWEVRYPDADVVTANEIHIPVGRPVQLDLRSDNVIHSFWVPRLHGKLDLIPGAPTSMTLLAEEPGVYLGECAEFCGIQHAKMQFLVIAQDADEFEAWLAAQQQLAVQPTTAALRAGADAFFDNACASCHTIRGTPAGGQVGPDLTHFGSRRTIGAGTVPNTRGYLGGWIVDSQSIKPGNLMPPIPLPAERVQDLIAYLESLR
jgi:cytochrome c oxidase subunit 2